MYLVGIIWQNVCCVVFCPHYIKRGTIFGNKVLSNLILKDSHSKKNAERCCDECREMSQMQRDVTNIERCCHKCKEMLSQMQRDVTNVERCCHKCREMLSQMYIDIHVKYPILFSDFN